MSKKLRMIDLFAGVGGIRLAFENNGCKCVFSSEWDTFSKKTYFANFGEMPFGDITQIEAKEIPDHDILTAGFPCQPFSSIGKRQGFSHPTQGTLFFDVVRILLEKKPKAFLLENVSGLVNHDKGRTLEIIMNTLQNELKYKTDFRVLNSINYGVPQSRERIYIVGFSDEIASKDGFEFNWPEKNKNIVGVGQFVEKDVNGYSISEHLQKVYLHKVNDGRPQIIDSNFDAPVKTLVSSYHKIQRLTGTFVRDGETGLRLLSANECKAIMGFPKDFKIPVSRTQMYRQMGNSVAVPVIEKIAKQITITLNVSRG
jgi:DNA (cytosine-5)-methyltransferase 1